VKLTTFADDNMSSVAVMEDVPLSRLSTKAVMTSGLFWVL